jgi:hypothetical protein
MRNLVRHLSGGKATADVDANLKAYQSPVPSSGPERLLLLIKAGTKPIGLNFAARRADQCAAREPDPPPTLH